MQDIKIKPQGRKAAFLDVWMFAIYEAEFTLVSTQQ